MHSVAIVPSAGKAERFGGGKLLADIGGEPLLNRTLRSVLEAGVERAVVVLAPGATFATVELLNDPRVRRVINPNPERGMFSSIQIGLAAEDGDLFLVLPGDMPFVKPSTVAQVVSETHRTGRIVSPRIDGRHGHPVGFPASLKAEILKADVSWTLADLLDAHKSDRAAIDVSDPGVLRDVDAREDLKR
jgi:molybdenum cofactor cytidylyltransferase